MFRIQTVVILCGLSFVCCATETTLQNDSLTNGSDGTIQVGFVGGEMAASWLTSPCDGNLVAAQIFWRSATGTTGNSIQNAINIYRSGSFPQPGILAETIGGPVLTDGALNEFRYLDKNSTIPLIVPVSANETVVVALQFASGPPMNGPSVVNDMDGIQPNRNAIYAKLGSGYQWLGNSTLGVTGDWVIRAVVDCESIPTSADIAVSMEATPAAYQPGNSLDYTITASNAGAADSNISIAALFPSVLQNISWTCAASNGASCTQSVGTGNILQSAFVPTGGAVEYTVLTTVAAGTNGTIEVSAQASTQSPVTDPDTSNNSATVSTPSVSDLIFADDFEP